MDSQDQAQSPEQKLNKRFFRKKAFIAVGLGILITIAIIFSRRLVSQDFLDSVINSNIDTANKLGPDDYEIRTLSIEGKTFEVEVADTVEKRRKGLSNRDNLPTGKGMLFIFEYHDIHSFWMKDTKFPLDMIWLDDDFKPLYIQRNVPPCTSENDEDCEIYTPDQASKYVLEVNAGEF